MLVLEVKEMKNNQIERDYIEIINQVYSFNNYYDYIKGIIYNVYYSFSNTFKK